MVESKLVELVVAGSNPVGHPMFVFRHLQDKYSRLPQKAKSLSENSERQYNFGLKPALTPGEGETVSVALMNHAFGWLKTVPRSNCQSNTFHNFQTDSDKLLTLGNDLKF
jgi:hypothetical protein